MTGLRVPGLIRHILAKGPGSEVRDDGVCHLNERIDPNLSVGDSVRSLKKLFQTPKSFDIVIVCVDDAGVNL